MSKNKAKIEQDFETSAAEILNAVNKSETESQPTKPVEEKQAETSEVVENTSEEVVENTSEEVTKPKEDSQVSDSSEDIELVVNKEPELVKKALNSYSHLLNTSGIFILKVEEYKKEESEESATKVTFSLSDTARAAGSRGDAEPVSASKTLVASVVGLTMDSVESPKEGDSETLAEWYVKATSEQAASKRKFKFGFPPRANVKYVIARIIRGQVQSEGSPGVKRTSGKMTPISELFK